MTKYAKYYQEMWTQHQDLFMSFQDVHDNYRGDQRSKDKKNTFDIEGKKVRAICEEWDQRLCSQMEKGQNGVFSSKVSEKFWSEVKKDFPLIDLVGVEISFS